MQYYPMGHRPRKLSVTGAMEDIQSYKLMKAKADMAPTLVERAKLELEWDKKDRPYDLSLKKQAVKKGEQDIVAKERESLLNYYNDWTSMAKWILEGKTEGEQRKRYDSAKRLMTTAHEDHVTSSPSASAELQKMKSQYSYDPDTKLLYREDNWGLSEEGGRVGIGPRQVLNESHTEYIDSEEIVPNQEFVTLSGGAPRGEQLDWNTEYKNGLQILKTPSPTGKPGDLIPDFDIEEIKTVASLAAEKARKLQPVDPTKDIVDMGTGDIVRKGKEKVVPEKMTQADLTKRALAGDKEAAAILADMHKRKIEEAQALGEAQSLGRTSGIDTEGVARAIVQGRETIENVKNTFGVPVQEIVRKEVLELDPKFDFMRPRLTAKAISSSLTMQYKQRGMMGSFVANLNKQISRVDEMMKDVVSRVGVRAIDLPMRELKTRFKGSGAEKALEAYMLEISNEIGKLSTGSSQSIRELSTDAQERWAKIHDPNLSIKELKTILEETTQMADMRLTSTDDEISYTLDLLSGLTKKKGTKKEPTKKPTDRFKILKVE